MSSRAAERESNIVPIMLVGLLVVSAVALAIHDLPALTEGGNHIPDGSNNDWIHTLSSELQGGFWDPRDPDVVRRLINFLRNAGIPLAVIATIVGVAISTAHSWGSGKTKPGYAGRMSVLQRVQEFLDSLH